MIRKIVASTAIAAGMVLAAPAIATAADEVGTGSAGSLGAFLENLGTGLSSTHDWPPNAAQPVDDAGVGTSSSDPLFGLLATYLGIDRPGSVA